ncbi:uncharacterized protein Dsimw501_GD27961 [Drosophila simulans]|uniref:Uncharacterized protein n=1 Tax=Drosophila simulans TaxID=7240 RepID=A0A0J9RJN7_DROSI|nr:uncharacterized protein Dsimw501_GD27961 [Drosophila simulans]
MANYTITTRHVGGYWKDSKRVRKLEGVGIQLISATTRFCPNCHFNLLEEIATYVDCRNGGQETRKVDSATFGNPTRHLQRSWMSERKYGRTDIRTE